MSAQFNIFASFFFSFWLFIGGLYQWYKWRNEWVEVGVPFTLKAGGAANILVSPPDGNKHGIRVTAKEDLEEVRVIVRRKDLIEGAKYEVYTP